MAAAEHLDDAAAQAGQDRQHALGVAGVGLTSGDGSAGIQLGALGVVGGVAVAQEVEHHGGTPGSSAMNRSSWAAVGSM